MIVHNFTTLKCRHHDWYVSVSYNLSSPTKNLQIKFEEDIEQYYSSESFLFQHHSNKMPNLSNFISPNKNVNDIQRREAVKES